MRPASLISSTAGATRSVARAAAATELHMLFCFAALFTISWDLLGNVQVGTYNVKLSVLLFACAAATSLVAPRPPAASPAQRSVGAAIGFLIGAYLLGALLAVDTSIALTQFVTVVLGALVPYWAVSRAVRLGGDPRQLLTAFVSGAVLASLYGFYQLATYSLPLPDPVPYQGVGGGQGRIASFSYEPAYFGYFLILALGAYAAREAMGGKKGNRLSLAVIIGALLLCNSRAVVFTLPLVAALLMFRAPYLHFRRRLGAPLLLAAGATLTVLVASPGLWAFLSERLSSIVNTNEPTSNAPRLDVYSAIVSIVRSNWEFGIGPGGLIRVGPSYGLFIQSNAPNRLVANNIWLQALSDGGVLLTAAHVVLILVVVTQLFRHRLPAARALIAGWLAIVLVGGMLTSYFYDLKLWVVLGLATGLASLPSAVPDHGLSLSGDRSLSYPAGGVLGRWTGRPDASVPVPGWSRWRSDEA